MSKSDMKRRNVMGDRPMSDGLDMKNGKTFEASDEYLYQKKIEELIVQRDKLAEGLKFYADENNWDEDPAKGWGDWYLIESTDRGNLARQTLKDAGVE
jgi:hypothetical protein